MEQLHSFLRNLIFLISFIFPTFTSALEFDIGDFSYQTTSDSKVTVCVYKWGWSNLKPNLEIPSSVEYGGYINVGSSNEIWIPIKKYAVTAIGDRAFNNNGIITSVTIPNSVISIGKEAFQNSWNL